MKRLALPLATALIAAGCVWPVPLPGEPVPSIEIETTWSAVAGTITIDITTPNLTPADVRMQVPSAGGTIHADDTAPFSFTLDTAELDPGTNSVTIAATDGTTYVAEVESIEVSSCNGHRELCERPYDQVRNVTTHNAMSNATDGWTGPNHNLDVPAQLASGVRALMIDTYRAGDLNGIGLVQVPGVDPDDPYLCHTFCSLGSQPLVEGLVEIREFLDADPGAVVTLIVESYLDHDLTAAAFIAAGLDDYAYTHAGGAWPTLGELIDSGERLVVLQDRSVDSQYPWLMHVWTWAFETGFSNAVPSDFTCNGNRGNTSSDLFILNHFLTNVFGSPELAAQVNGNPLLIDRAEQCEAVHGRAATFVTVDFSDIGDVFAAVDILNGVG